MSYRGISDDDILKGIGRAILEEEQGVAFANTEREEQFAVCEDLVRKMFAGQKVKIRAVPHDDLPSVGTIEVIGKGLTIPNPYVFGAAAALAHNYEFYSKLNGDVVLALTFYNMTTKF